jgi:hypothetical protein
MKRSLGGVGALALAAMLAGCAGRHPVPYNVGGRYYMAGDPQCVSFKKVGGKILCRDARGHVTGKRRAMTTQELMMYTYRQQMRQLRSIEAELMFSRGPWWGPWGW